jgi:hypothetical protein
VLRDEDFDRARKLVDGALPERPGSSCRLQFDGGIATWHLVVEDGRVTSWALGELPDRDAEVRWRPDDAKAILAGQLEGEEAHARTTIAERGPGGEYIGPPPPMDLAQRHAELEAMPLLPGATVLTSYRFTSGPFGDLLYYIRLEDGRVVDMGLGEPPDHDVRVVVSYRAMADVRNGTITIIEALGTGSVDGKIGPMALLAGVSEGPEFHLAEEQGGPAGLALATHGELREVAAFREACAALAGAS